MLISKLISVLSASKYQFRITTPNTIDPALLVKIERSVPSSELGIQQ